MDYEKLECQDFRSLRYKKEELYKDKKEFDIISELETI